MSETCTNCGADTFSCSACGARVDPYGWGNPSTANPAPVAAVLADLKLRSEHLTTLASWAGTAEKARLRGKSEGLRIAANLLAAVLADRPEGQS